MRACVRVSVCVCVCVSFPGHTNFITRLKVLLKTLFLGHFGSLDNFSF